MDRDGGLVFTWDPRVREWLKERGPEDAASPFVAPVDDEAVQTFFLDIHNGRWTPTVLGLQARQIAFELGKRGRAPLTQQLAFDELRPRAKARQRRGPARLAVALVALLAVAAVFYLLQVGGGNAFGTVNVVWPELR